MQMPDMVAGVAEYDGTLRFDKPQHIDNRMFNFIGCHAHGTILDVGMGAHTARSFNAQGIFLITLGKIRNALWHCGRKQKRAPLCGRCLQDKFEVFPESEIKHFICFIQHHGFQALDVKHTALKMVPQATRCTNDDVCAIAQAAAFAFWVHAADAR